MIAVTCERDGGKVYKCRNGSCIPGNWECDGHYDCYPEGEDEAACPGNI